jgi:hypothetical protein
LLSWKHDLPAVGHEQFARGALAEREERIAMADLPVQLDDPRPEGIRALRHAHEQPGIAELADVAVGGGARVGQLRGNVVHRPHRGPFGKKIDHPKHPGQARFQFLPL